MNLTITFLGLELLSLHVNTEPQHYDEPGDCTTTPIGFGGYAGDQRYESSPGVDIG